MKALKTVAIILIISYLLLPTFCFSQPCEAESANAQHRTVSADAVGACPISSDSDSAILPNAGPCNYV